ncbi:hypothetical protein PTRA_a1245 [Pseudoalteromonas translucida KMM 520]|uniref:DUF1440 domain-containing protein n=1 Tax=Pseudoalteromonas translucida KMM 520 TaxID=1315283 RepID=A0A0U2WY04_9GAMM|nr:hypothetical protein [Pseudoalteromonas translucida]ALS32489.1 hypothetical protein PTRA_a1245 [Pseudoalteromonas translucida KMM 520]
MTNHDNESERLSANMFSSILIMLFAGALATVIFDFWGPSLSPLLGFAELSTIKLPRTMIEVIFGTVPTGTPELIHYITGLILYPLGWLFVVLPMRKAIMPSLHWSITAVVYGIVLWVFALYVVAHLIIGLPPFIGFTETTWVALIGHILYALVFAWGAQTRSFK